MNIEKRVRRYFELINEERFDEFFSLFAPDVEFYGPFDFHAQGIEAMKPYYLDVPVRYPEHVDTPVKIMVSGDEAAVLIAYTARTRGGLSIAFEAMDWFVFEEGKIASLRVFFDSHHLARMLAEKP